MPRPAQKNVSEHSSPQPASERGLRKSGASVSPPNRTVRLHPAVAIGIFSSPLILIAIIVVLYLNREEPPALAPEETDDNVVYQKILGDVPEAEELYMKAMSLRSSGDQPAFAKAMDVARDKIMDLLEQFDAILESVRDSETGDLPDDYGQYDRDYQKLTRWLHDLQKTAGF